jgi:hypothetical protein
MDQALKAVHVKYIAEQVLWVDSQGMAHGPGTVVAVARRPQFQAPWELTVLDHNQQIYRTLSSGRWSFDIIEFSEDEFLALPQILQDEIALALEYGPFCSANGWADERCTDRRLYGCETCEEHNDPNWPYVDQAELEDWA